MCFLILLKFGESIMDWIAYPQNSYVEGMIPNMTVFGDKAFKEVIKINRCPEGQALIQQGH